MTITSETLELAALAAGIEIEWHDDIGLCLAQPADSYAPRVVWRPHTDPGDAARLAVRLRLAVGVDHAEAEVVDIDGHIIAQVPHNDTDEDAERAYREAVTLGAAHEGRWIRDNRAAIGRRMREGGR